MKTCIMLWSGFLLFVLPVLSTTKGEERISRQQKREDNGKVFNRNKRALQEKQMIVVSMPGAEHSSVYGNYYEALAKFIKDLDVATRGYDDLAIVMDDETWWKYFDDDSAWWNKTDAYFCEMPNGESLDAWIRDYSPLGAYDPMVQFLYYPGYLDEADATLTIQSMEYLLTDIIKVSASDYPTKNTELIVDGGNYIDNGNDKAVLTKRVFWENEEDFTQASIKEKIKTLMNKDVVFVDDDPDDTTGHIDGVSAFISEDILLINECDLATAGKVIKDKWNDVAVITLPCPQKSTSNARGIGFTTAIGWYANALITKNSIYIPKYGLSHDATALNIYETNSNKPNLVQIDTSKISDLGGSVRCLTWNVGGSTPIAQAIRRNCYHGPSTIRGGQSTINKNKFFFGTIFIAYIQVYFLQRFGLIVL